jgi:hypothetical protein
MERDAEDDLTTKKIRRTRPALGRKNKKKK